MAPNHTQLQNMIKKEGETFKEYAQRWRDLAAQVAPPMVEREMLTMMVDTLPVFYNEKLVAYMPSSFADLVFAEERIEVGLKRGKFDYVSSTSANAKRIGATREKKEGRRYPCRYFGTRMGQAPADLSWYASERARSFELFSSRQELFQFSTYTA